MSDSGIVSADQWAPQMRASMQKSEPEFQIPSPGTTFLSMKGIPRSVSPLRYSDASYLSTGIMHSAHQEYNDSQPKVPFQSAILKETIDDLEWPGSSIQIRMQPDPPTVIFRGEGHGDLQVC